MTTRTWQPPALDRENAQPLHVQIVRQVRAALTTGSLRPGDLLPPEPELADQLGVARATLRLALRRLANEGLILRRRGQGTCIAERAAVMYQPVRQARVMAAEGSTGDDILEKMAGLQDRLTRLNGQMDALKLELAGNREKVQQASDRTRFSVSRARSDRARRQAERVQRTARPGDEHRADPPARQREA